MRGGFDIRTPYGSATETFTYTKMAAADVSHALIGGRRSIQLCPVHFGLRLLIAPLGNGKMNWELPDQYAFANWPANVRLPEMYLKRGEKALVKKVVTTYPVTYYIFNFLPKAWAGTKGDIRFQTPLHLSMVVAVFLRERKRGRKMWCPSCFTAQSASREAEAEQPGGTSWLNSEPGGPDIVRYPGWGQRR